MGRRSRASKSTEAPVAKNARRTTKTRPKRGAGRILGQDEGVFTVPEDFNKTDEDLLRAFEGDDRPITLT